MMEFGIPIVIKPKYAKALFIPLNGQYNGDDFDSSRGFTMTSKAVEMVPGEQFRGMFSAFWEAWWSTQGELSMVELAERVATVDSSVIADSSMEARQYVKGPTKRTFTIAVSSARAAAKMRIAAMQAKRRAGYKHNRVKREETFKG